VQGVWFRASTCAEAERLGLRGWVRNLSDGTVEAHFEGDADAVAEMIAWCRRGPSGADVASVDVVDAGGDDTAAGFQIR
jgi:acylphosphatase